ncbi:T9SS type A sorting domain-containing protein [Ekhidna sp.]
MKNFTAALFLTVASFFGFSQNFNTTITALGPNPFSTESIRINVEFANDIAAYTLGKTEIDEEYENLLNNASANARFENLTSPDSRTLQFDVYPFIDGPVHIYIPDGAVFDASGNTNLPAWIILEYQGAADEPIKYSSGLPGSYLILEWALAESNGITLEDPIPQGITDVERSPNGNIFLVDAVNDRIRQPDGFNPHAKYAGADTPGFDGGYLDGDRLVAMFNVPRNIAIDNSNNLYISDVGNNRIRRIASNGDVTTIAGNGTAGFETGDALTSSISISEIAVSDDGSIVYFSDAIGNIKKLESGQISDVIFVGTSTISSIQVRQSGTLLIASQQGLVEYNEDDGTSTTLISNTNVMDVIEDENGDVYCVVAGDDINGNPYEFGLINVFKIENGTDAISFIINADLTAATSIVQIDPLFLFSLVGNNGVSLTNGAGNTLLISVGTTLWSLDLTIATTDDPPVFENPIADINTFENRAPLVIPLDGVATDEDNSDDAIVYEIAGNTNAGLVTTDITDGELTLTFTAATTGTATLTVRATSNGESVDDDFVVTVEEAPASLYEQSGVLELNATSQIFPDFGGSFAEIADDFSVPEGEVWDIRTVSVVGSTTGAFSEAVFTIYENNAGVIGDQVFRSEVLPTETYDFTGSNASQSGNYRLALENTTELGEGDYWISVQTQLVFDGGGLWSWGLYTPTVGAQIQGRDPDGLGTGYPTTFGSLGVDAAMIFQIAGSVRPDGIFLKEASICDGDEFAFGAQTLTTAGEYTETFTDQLGGDSTVVLTLTIDPVYNETASLSICSGEDYIFGTQTLSAAGEYTELFTSISGCDSTVVLTLSIDPIFNETAEVAICAGEDYVFGSQVLSTAGEYTEVFSSQAGCDSTVMLTLSVDPIFNETAEVVICNGEDYVFGSQTLNVAGEYTELFTSQSGCDSTVVLTLTVNPTFNESANASICAGEDYVFGTQTLNTPGEYTELFSSQSGCDSTVILTLSVDPLFNETANASICPGEDYIFGSQTLNTAGEFTEVFTSQSGCDSTVVLTLSIDPIYNETAEARICSGEDYIFGTQTLSVAGEYTELFESQAGCDSTVVLTLNVDPTYNETEEAVICDGESFVFGTQTLTSAGTFTEVFASELGCDSTVVLDLTVNPVFNESISESICAGESFVFGTQTLTLEGEYSQLFMSELGCDSTVTLSLTVDPEFDEVTEASICPGDSYTFGSQTLTNAGEYTESFLSQAGCDSVVTLSLSIAAVFDENVAITICADETFAFGTQTLTAAGEYTELFTSQVGCDSTVNLSLFVTDFDLEVSLTDQTLTATEIDGASYQWITCEGIIIDGATTNIFQATETGEYAVIVDNQECEKTTACILVELPLSTSSIGIDPIVYPNPTKGIITLDFQQDFRGTYEIFDLAGKSVTKGTIDGSNKSVSIEESPNGMYHLFLKNENGVSERLTVVKVGK